MFEFNSGRLNYNFKKKWLLLYFCNSGGGGGGGGFHCAVAHLRCMETDETLINLLLVLTTI